MKRCNRLLIRGFPTDPVPQVFAKPLKALSRISEYYAAKLLADTGYNAVLSHNPMSAAHGPGFVTNWFHRQP